jgi:predicted transcriptional regulator
MEPRQLTKSEARDLFRRLMRSDSWPRSISVRGIEHLESEVRKALADPANSPEENLKLDERLARLLETKARVEKMGPVSPEERARADEFVARILRSYDDIEEDSPQR